jgi:hypothetical protein
MRKLTILILLTTLFASCAPMETTRTETVVPEAVPVQRGTFAIVPFDETVAVGVFNEKVLEGLEAAVEEGMKENGYGRGKKGSDVLVALYVVREEQFQSHDWGYMRGWKTPEWDAYWLKRRATSRELPEGTIVIDIIDTREKKHIWGGSSAPVLFPSAEGEVENIAAENAIAVILREYR